MILREILDDATRRFESVGIASPRVDAEWLLAHVLKVPRMQLGLISEIDSDSLATFESLVQRRMNREPLQHITGTAAFRTIELEVGPGVFVPRPETELLAGWAIDAAKRVLENENRTPIVVDLATGSGAIAAAIKTELAQAQVHAIEIDPKAFAYAERNLNQLDVDLALGDLADAFYSLNGQVDVVVSNPPYIPLTAWESVAVEARDFDPQQALFSGQDGLDAIRTIERTAARLLHPGGVLGFEHADLQGETAPAVLLETGRWEQVVDHLDLAQKPRFVTATRASG